MMPSSYLATLLQIALEQDFITAGQLSLFTESKGERSNNSLGMKMLQINSKHGGSVELQERHLGDTRSIFL